MDVSNKFLHISSCIVDVYETGSDGEITDGKKFQLIADGCLADDDFIRRNVCKFIW